jgi:hypothetical protein
MDVFLAYEKHQQLLAEEVRAEVEKFLLKIVGEVIFKGSAVLFKKLSIILAKNEDKKLIGFVVGYLEGLLRKGEKVSRASQLLFILQEDDYEKLSAVAASVLELQGELNHSFVHLLINSIITLPEKYLLTQAAIDRYAFIDPLPHLADRSLQAYKPHLFMLSTHRFNSSLLAKLSHYLAQAAQPAADPKTRHELIKATYSIATSAIAGYVQFYETEETVDTIASLLEVLFGIFDFKMDLQVDFKQLEDALKHLFASKYEHPPHFHRLLDAVARGLPRLPAKKQADLLRLIASRPANFLFSPPAVYHRFLVGAVALEEASAVYRDLLLSISTLLAYVPVPLGDLLALAESLPRPQTLLLLQAQVLATLEIGSSLVERVLRESGRERRKVFCKEMLLARGKKEYLDAEEQAQQWKLIKTHSNPYHYHA